MALLRVLGKTLFWLGVWASFSACSSVPQDYDPEYHQNLFYIGAGEAPIHEKKAHLDFFDKECSGSSGHNFSCHYTDQ